MLITAGLGIMIGSVTFSGSLIAAGKLQGIKWVKKLNLPGKGVWNILFAVLAVASLVMLCVQPEQRLLWSILTTVFALCYGLVFVIPIGGADMPVVISVLNACTGTAVAMSGLAINNIALIVAGALVGSAGVTLSILMAQAMNRPLLSVLAGQTALIIDNLASAAGHIRGGKLIALAVTTKARTPLMPEIPTVEESGIPDFDIYTWFGLQVPASTPDDVVQKLHDAFAPALATEEMKKRCEGFGATPAPMTPAEFDKLIADEYAKYDELGEIAGAKVD